MRAFSLPLLLAATCLVFGLTACGGDGARADGSADPGTAKSATGLTPDQQEKGIGPVRTVELTTQIDEHLAENGEAIFNMKCTACHKMNERYVGPPLGDVTARRTPEFVMNMMLNPAEMIEKHPAVRELLAQYMTPMPNQNLSQEDARAILEYLRKAGTPATMP